jgi:hypothetical protein
VEVRSTTPRVARWPSGRSSATRSNVELDREFIDGSAVAE